MIVSPITPHSKRLYSHRAGWGHLWSNRLDAAMAYDSDYSKAPTIYLEHGMEFREDSKGLNYFLKSKESYDKLAERLELLQNYSGEVVSLDILLIVIRDLILIGSIKFAEVLRRLSMRIFGQTRSS